MSMSGLVGHLFPWSPIRGVVIFRGGGSCPSVAYGGGWEGLSKDGQELPSGLMFRHVRRLTIFLLLNRMEITLMIEDSSWPCP